MSCQLVSDQLCGYLDGDSTLAVRLEIEIHLLRCPPCRCLVQTCRQTIQVYRRQPAPPLPAALHRKLMDKIAAARPPFAR